MKALGEAATDLPWLSPCAGSLVALARNPTAAVWTDVRSDPGCVLLLLRPAADHNGVAGPSFSPAWFREPTLLETARKLLHQPASVDWNRPDVIPIYRACLSQARLAQALARNIPNCDPDCAWSGGLLAPLGWLAVCAVDQAQAGACLGHPSFAHNPSAVQQQLWGLDHTAIARRLSRRWRLPPWLATLLGHLGLPVGISQTLGADPLLFQVVQLAIGLVQQKQQGLGLTIGTSPEELIASLGLSGEQIEHALIEAREEDPPTPDAWNTPADLSLLPGLLDLAIENRRQVDALLVERLQSDIDHLQRALEEQWTGEKERLRTLKLKALAELAAGAGHEINNPLAVISGQAQHLAAHETDPGRLKALQAIVNQAQRIHEILTELMQFARPPAPQRQRMDAAELMHAVADSLRTLAEQRQVRLVCPDMLVRHQVLVDPGQVQIALRALLRNAIEAAPADGWAGLRLEESGGQLHFIVEDSGPGPSALAREHLFDPFYSGRTAGRGRGLGLSTAWRLAKQQGGEVRFAGAAHGPTSFILTLPAIASLEGDHGDNGHLPERNGASGRFLGTLT